MKPRDLELLSSYLDGQLSPSDVTRLESRLKTDPRLADVLSDLRATRNLLRKLPKRRAPRNFTLTRKMVGQNPPLPRTYPLFRFASALASLLFVFSFGLNAVGRMASQPPVFGMGGGGGAEVTEQEQSTELFSVQEAPAESAPSAEMAPMPTSMPQADTARTEGTPSEKEATGMGNAAEAPDQLPAGSEALTSPAPLVSSAWQIGLAVVAALSAVLMYLTRRMAMSRWK